MSFLDRAKDLAKNAATVTTEAAKTAAEKTQDAVETTKINAKIREEKNAIETLKKELGEYFLQKARAGENDDPYLAEVSAKVDEHERTIKSYEASIEEIREK